MISHPINQPEVTCGRQKPRFGRSRLCRSRSRSQRSLHSPLPGEFAVALTHVTSHDETQETYGSFENKLRGVQGVQGVREVQGGKGARSQEARGPNNGQNSNRFPGPLATDCQPADYRLGITDLLRGRRFSPAQRIPSALLTPGFWLPAPPPQLLELLELLKLLRLAP